LLRACIDIGSNTTRLLVADLVDGRLTECRQERAFTQIGRSLDAAGAIPAMKLAEVAAVVARHLAVAREAGAEQVRCVATAGVRRATNGAALVELIASTCDGLEVEVLSGADESRLAFIGAAWGAGGGSDVVGVVDAGGGSSELAVGQPPDRLRWWVSLPLGSGDITAHWQSSGPPPAIEIERAREHVRAAFAPARPPKVERVIAVGGSATTMRLLAGSVLDADAFRGLLGTVQRFSPPELAARFGIDVQRAELLPGGLVLLEAISELFQAPLEIGRGGLREGLLLDYQ